MLNPKTVENRLQEAVQAMIESGREDYQVDPIWLMSEVTGLSRSQMRLMPDRLLSQEESLQFDGYMKERLAGKPLQYILGVQAFYGYDFEVNEHVLIPRFETEELVEKAIVWSKQHGSRTMLDMCTGSGCIGLTVLKECPDMSGILVDLSKDALAVAGNNAVALSLDNRVEIIQSDLFHKVPPMKVDMILSNPPYIVSDVIPSLDREVKSEEPYMALDGGADGLEFYRKIATQAKDYLNDHGLLLFEIGYDQSDQVKAILKREGYNNIEGYKDLSGKDRMVQGMR